MTSFSSLFSRVWVWSKQHVWYSSGGVLLLCFIVYKVSASGTAVQPISPSDIYRVHSGSITNVIKVLGNTKITDQQVLTFAQEGTVKKVYVKEGQFVKKGDVLAELDKKSLKNDMAQQSLSIQNAKLNYQKLVTQYTDADKLKAQNDVTNMQAKLTQAKKDLQEMLANKGGTLQTKSPQVQSFLISAKSSFLDAKNILEDIDEVYGITEKNKYLHSNMLIYLSANNNSEKTRVENLFNSVNSKIGQVQSILSSLESSTTLDIQVLQNFHSLYKDLLQTLGSAVSHAKSGVGNSMVGSILPQSQVDTWYSLFASDSSKVVSLLSSLNNDVKSLQSTESDIVSKQNDVKNYEAQLALNQETLQTILRGGKVEDKILQQNNIKQMQISLSKLSEQSDNYELIANFDGNVDVVSMKQGDNITMDNISDKSITVSNPDFYEIDMLIDQVDIVKIDKGQSIEATFDAYPNYMVTGMISEIDPTPTTNAGVVSYTAKINMTKAGKKVYDGMTVNVKIITEKKENILLVPTTSLQTLGTGSAVQLMARDGTTPLVPVSIGISDGQNTEILSGIVFGERILLKEYTVTTTTQTAQELASQKNAASARNSTRGLGVGGRSAGDMGAGGPQF